MNNSARESLSMSGSMRSWDSSGWLNVPVQATDYMVPGTMGSVPLQSSGETHDITTRTDTLVPALPGPGNIFTYAATRAMSPNLIRSLTNDPFQSMGSSISNASLLIRYQTRCMSCRQMAPDLPVCVQCGVVGQGVCIGMNLFQGFCFCAHCLKT